jgi:hypothetical protein
LKESLEKEQKLEEEKRLQEQEQATLKKVGQLAFASLGYCRSNQISYNIYMY